jgi:hypothetical protein
MSPLSLSEHVIVKREDFNRQFVDGAGIIHIFLFLKSQQNAIARFIAISPSVGRSVCRICRSRAGSERLQLIQIS